MAFKPNTMFELFPVHDQNVPSAALLVFLFPLFRCSTILPFWLLLSLAEDNRYNQIYFIYFSGGWGWGWWCSQNLQSKCLKEVGRICAKTETVKQVRGIQKEWLFAPQKVSTRGAKRTPPTSSTSPLDRLFYWIRGAEWFIWTINITCNKKADKVQ